MGSVTRLSRRAVVRGLARLSVSAAGLAIGAGCGLPLAQEQRSRHRMVAYVTGGTPEIQAPNIEVLRAGMRQLGWIEGENLVIEFRFGEGDAAKLPQLVSEVLQLRPDVILATSSPAAKAAKAATGSVPIVIMSVSDPVAQGLVGSLARPGGNITGVAVFGAQLAHKRLELLAEVSPHLSRVAILLDRADSSSLLYLRDSVTAARALGLELIVLWARTVDDFEPGFEAMAAQRAEGLVVAGSALLNVNQQRIMDFTKRMGVPTVYANRSRVEAGGLMSLGTDDESGPRRAAIYVDRILRGANPAELPIQQPTDFQLVVNLSTAKALGLTIPSSVAAQVTDWVD